MRVFATILLGCLIIGCADDEPGLMSQWDAAASGNAPVQEVAAEKEKPKLVVMTKREAKLVDKQKAMAENPKLIEVENKINASDPLTAISQGYFSIGSQAQVLAMKHNINIQREIDDRWPTFEEFQKSMKQADARLGALYAYQMYAYDQTTGGITILEDRAEKKRQYEAAGRDYPHAD